MFEAGRDWQMMIGFFAALCSAASCVAFQICNYLFSLIIFLQDRVKDSLKTRKDLLLLFSCLSFQAPRVALSSYLQLEIFQLSSWNNLLFMCFSFCTVTQLTGDDNNYWIKCFPALFTLQIWCYNDQTWTGRVSSLNNNNVWRWWVISLKARRVSRPFSRGVTFTHARVSFALPSLRKNGTSRSLFNK